MAGNFVKSIAERAKKAAPVAVIEEEPEEGSDAEEATEPASEEKTEDAGGYGDVEKSALNDIAGVLKVPKEARGKFDSALTELIEACVKKNAKE